MHLRLACIAVVLILVLQMTPCRAEPFTDTEFRGSYTTETLDAIIEKYELYDGWYWTEQAGVDQDFHGHENKPGWTDTAVNRMKKKDYEKGWYGCRWGRQQINARIPNDYGSGECYGFAQFIGYLLSGEKNPHGNWKRYYSVGAAGGLRPGDIVRAEYEMGGYKYMHSAVVYSVEGNTVLFLQVAGAQYNLIRTRQGYTDGYLKDETDLRKIRSLPNIIVYRSREAR